MGDTYRRKAALALTALQNVRKWSIQPYDLRAVESGIARQFALELIDEGLLPPNELNDARILAEVAVAGISMLVSSDSHLLSVPKDRLAELLGAKDLGPVVIFGPKAIVHALAPRRRISGRY